MECFIHPDTSAMGICKYCCKGLCHECAVDLGYGITCKGECAEQLRIHRELIDRTARMQQVAGQGHRQRAYFVGLLGLFFLCLGFFFEDQRLFMMFVPIGTLFLLFALYQYKQTNKFYPRA